MPNTALLNRLQEPKGKGDKLMQIAIIEQGEWADTPSRDRSML